MDCIGRVVTRSSDWEHRESATWPVKRRGSGRALRERSRYNACSSSRSAEGSNPGDCLQRKMSMTTKRRLGQSTYLDWRSCLKRVKPALDLPDPVKIC